MDAEPYYWAGSFMHHHVDVERMQHSTFDYQPSTILAGITAGPRQSHHRDRYLSSCTNACHAGHDVNGAICREGTGLAVCHYYTPGFGIDAGGSPAGSVARFHRLVAMISPLF